ncbi:hypothetical protein GCM10010518_28630 [Kitasatospora cinereorecta]
MTGFVTWRRHHRKIRIAEPLFSGEDDVLSPRRVRPRDPGFSAERVLSGCQTSSEPFLTAVTKADQLAADATTVGPSVTLLSRTGTTS